MKAFDCSQYQGNIDWNKVKAAGYEIVYIRISYGYNGGLYYDPMANANYYGAKAAGLAVGLYHYAGDLDPTKEADFFLNGCKPFEEGDVFIIDYDSNHDVNPQPQWVVAFIQRVIDITGVKPLAYMNTNMTQIANWSSVVKMDIGLILANYAHTPDETCPFAWWSTYVMHQYTSKGRINGIAGDVDLNEWFGTKEQFIKYGYKAPVTPPPVVTPTPVPVPTPTPTPIPTPEPEKPPVVVTPPTPTVPDTPKETNFIEALVGFIMYIISLVKGKNK